MNQQVHDDVRRALQEEKQRGIVGRAHSMARAIVNGLIREIQAALENGDAQFAFALAIEAKSFRLPVESLDYWRGQTHLLMGQPEDAVQCFREELRHFPDNTLAQTLLAEVQQQQGRSSADTDAAQSEYDQMVALVRNHTMLSEERLKSLYTLAKAACQQDIPGNFIECGVAGGGSSALLAMIIARYSKRPRLLYSLDTFEGMPDSGEADTHKGVQAEATGWGAGTCAAPETAVRRLFETLGVSEYVRTVKGLFQDTLPVVRGQVAPVAFLHLDGDWYDSTMTVLENLDGLYSPGATIQIDDYGYWEGCRKAVHEFELARGLRLTLHTIDGTGVWCEAPQKSRPATGLPRSERQGGPQATSAAPRMLNLGCGGRCHPAWINVDRNPLDPKVIRHDITSTLPFEDESVDVVYHSHVLEHLPRGLAPAFLRDCHRVLRPGGLMRVVVPDLESAARAYIQSLEQALEGGEGAGARHEWMVIELIDQLSRHVPGGEMSAYFRKQPMPAEEFVYERLGGEGRDSVSALRSSPRPGLSLRVENDPAKLGAFRLSGECRLWMYDRHSLGRLLEHTGFTGLRVCRADESSLEDFNSFYLDVEADMSVRKPGSLFMEAFKNTREMNG